jgi:Txe/YoeB family toxin of Txe-Axe toxin-antitoxin module
MKLPSNIRFADEELKKAFYKLEKGDDVGKELFKAINKAIDNLEQNAFCGIQIPKKLMPKEYITEYKVKNLWKYNLPKGWRLMYSIVNDEIVVISLIVDWLKHKEYEKKFKY